MAVRGVHLFTGPDPRPEPTDEPVLADVDTLHPSVAGGGTRSGLWLVSGGATLLGLVTFLWLSSHRAPAAPEAQAAPADGAMAAVAPAPIAPQGVVAMEAAARDAALPKPPAAIAQVTPPPPVLPSPPPIGIPLAAPPPPPPAPPARAPVLVVDLAAPGGPEAVGAPAKAAAGAAANKTADQAHGAGGAGLNADEAFAARVESGPEPVRARATMLRNQSTVVPQGTMIPAVLETALNSDLPGYARALISRDVRSFDGSTVLIPRGSRVIGEYRSAVALGQSRAFVIWTRVLRPDGGSIDIDSGGGDTLGRAGLSGSVDHHFFQTFGGAVLMTVLNAGATALAGTPSTQVVVSSSQQATNLAGSVSAFAPVAIPPTIKVPQGTPLRIFVSRDLDFTPIQGPHK